LGAEAADRAANSAENGKRKEDNKGIKAKEEEEQKPVEREERRNDRPTEREEGSSGRNGKKVRKCLDAKVN
jgi:hypothetical protein